MKRAIKRIEEHDFIIEMKLPEKGNPSEYDADLVCIISPPYKEGDPAKFVTILENVLTQEMQKINMGYKVNFSKSQSVKPDEIILKTRYKMD